MLDKTALPTVEERCETCRYWWQPDDQDEDEGICRRFPPAWLRNHDHPSKSWAWRQPWTDGSCDWCGEWQPAGRQHNPPATPTGQ